MSNFVLMEYTNLIISGIKEILVKKNCVIVPQFGTFLCSRRQAYLNKEKNLFEPPFYHISFNPEIVMDESNTLVSFLVHETNFSFEEINFIIAKQVNEWKQIIHENKKLTFNNFGTLYVEGKNFYFEPFRNLIFPEYFGLKPVSLNKFLNEEQIIFHILPPVSYSFLKMIIFIPLVLALLLSPLKINSPVKKFSFLNTDLKIIKKEIKKINSNLRLIHKTDSLISLNQALMTENLIIDSNKIDTSKITNENMKKTDSIEVSTHKNVDSFTYVINKKVNKYFIVVGSFKRMHEAQYYYNELTKRFNNLKIIRTPEKIRVAIGPYDSREEANNAFVNLKNKHYNLIGWLLYY
ncbi:MAG: SPOR domain-containing protein [Bacteroidales bacterium]|nr:SPOR domain-containing protein [Bacteroidales bacterium]